MRWLKDRVELESKNCFYAAFFAVSISNCYGEGEMAPELLIHPSMWVADHVIHNKVRAGGALWGDALGWSCECLNILVCVCRIPWCMAPPITTAHSFLETSSMT